MIACLDGQSLPILDSDVLDELEDELADQTLVRRFANDYAALWEHRLGRLSAAVETRDRDAALDAAISVKVSAAMIGATRVSRLAETLERSLRDDVLHNSGTQMGMLAQSGAATVREIRLRYCLGSS